MKDKFAAITMFILVAIVAAGTYYLIDKYSNNNEESPAITETTDTGEAENAAPAVFENEDSRYTDSQNRYSLIPPEKWVKVDKDTFINQGKKDLPPTLRAAVNSNQVDVMFMDLENEATFGSNLNIITSRSMGLKFDNATFEMFRSAMTDQYKKMDLKNYKDIDGKLVEVNGISSAYFENEFSVSGYDLYNVQLIIPGARYMVILTYSFSQDEVSEELFSKIKESYRSFRFE